LGLVGRTPYCASQVPTHKLSSTGYTIVVHCGSRLLCTTQIAYLLIYSFEFTGHQLVQGDYAFPIPRRKMQKNRKKLKVENRYAQK